MADEEMPDGGVEELCEFWEWALAKKRELEERVAELSEKLFDLRLDGKVDEASFDEQLERLQDQIGELRLQLAGAQAEELGNLPRQRIGPCCTRSLASVGNTRPE